VCGASVRGTAHFCPHCGQPMAGAAAASSTAQTGAQSALVDEAERAAALISGRLAARDVSDAFAPDVANAPKSSDAKPDAPQSSTPAGDGAGATGATQIEDRARVESASPQVVSSVEASAGRVRQRAAAVGASVNDSLRPRVDKLRERSAVVLDEAADDPGLRFVLVAALLFVVALLLFIFSFALR
jgi:hypothetical protein